MMDEQVLVVPRKSIPDSFLPDCGAVRIGFSDFTDIVKLDEIQWLDRKIAETKVEYKQLIPYILSTAPGERIFIYNRSGSEARLHGKWSAGVGGHINPCDNHERELYSTFDKSIRREISEEFRSFPNDYEPKFIGLINEHRTEVGLVHLGLVFHIHIDEPGNVAAGDELSQLQLTDLHSISMEDDEYELWSRLAVKLLKGVF